jgi:hypothetical protein
MGEVRTYNPLNEGYSGKSIVHDGYSGKVNLKEGYSGSTNTNVIAPQTIKSLQSAIIKPAQIGSK